MEKKKFLLVPVLISAFSLVLLIFQIDGRTMLHFSTLKHTLVTFYKNKTQNYIKTTNTEFRTTKSATKAKLNVFRTNSILSFRTTTGKSTIGKVTTVTPTYNIPMTTSSLSKPQSSTVSKQTTIPPTSTISSTKTSTTHSHVVSSRRRYFLCPTFMGGLGNMLFQFASTFGIAMSKNMTVVVNINNDLNRAFKLNVDLRTDTGICRTLPSRTSRWDCAFDVNVVNFNKTQNFQVGHYLQSWKYFYRYRNELRKQLTFRKDIQDIANNIITNIVKKCNYSSKWEVTLVGVHVRRGDMVGHSFGYNVATPEYISKSVQYFLSKYKKVIFVVSTQDIKWTKSHMPNNTVVQYVSHPNREILVATLASCDHTITTVGSFSWWIGWLTGGEVTYFKWPAKEGTGLRHHYSKDFSDYFYPGWVGM